MPPSRFESVENTNSRGQKRKLFLKKLMQPSKVRGCLVCRLCGLETWAPNARHHMDKCPIIVQARADAKRSNARLFSIGTITIDETIFDSPSLPTPKKAKLEGFVMSSSALVNDPHAAPLPGESKENQKTGRKGYTRCIKCNAEVFGPNTRRHVCQPRSDHQQRSVKTR